MKATNELYLSCKGTIEKACLDAWRKTPMLDLDDYRSYANEVFMDAVRSFDPSLGIKFNSWLTTQLLRLKKYARDTLEVTDRSCKSESLVLSLDAASQQLDGRSCTLHDIKHPANDNYEKRIGVPEWAVSWEQRLPALKPYLGSLSEDAKILANDILDGNTAKKDEHGVPQLEHGHRLYSKLTPKQLYIRLYRRRGWEFERVRDARIEIEEMLRKWCTFPLPKMDDEMRTCNLTVRTFRDGSVVSRKSVKWDRFKHAVEECVTEEINEVQVQDELF